MQLLTATLTKPARQVTTKYGDRTVADVRLADGTETALWRPANDQSLANLAMGQSVTVAKDSKGKINLIDNPAPAVSPAPTQTTGINPDTKRAIADYIQEQTKLFGFCLSQKPRLSKAFNQKMSGPPLQLFICRLLNTLGYSRHCQNGGDNPPYPDR